MHTLKQQFIVTALIATGWFLLKGEMATAKWSAGKDYST